jgi:hypothetical protein
MLADALSKRLYESSSLHNFPKKFQFKTHDSIRAGVWKIKQVLLDSCSSKRMQAEHKHKALDKSSQARTDSEASKQYSDSFPVISFKSQHIWRRRCSRRGRNLTTSNLFDSGFRPEKHSPTSAPSLHLLMTRHRNAFSVMSLADMSAK